MPKKSESDSEDSKKASHGELQRKILENLVELQKVHANIAEKFDSLSQQISSLLTLFESAARSFAEHPANQVAEKDKDFLDKIDRLLDQNKTIAKGLTLLEDGMKKKVYGSMPVQEESSPREIRGEPDFSRRRLQRF